MRIKALAIVVLAVLLNSGDLTASPPSTSELLEKAIFTEETVGDLKAAIEIYRQILIESEANRSHVAQARYRLGMCHLKLGEKQEAVAAFQKLLDLFPEQKELAAQARARMSALGHPTAAMAIRKLPMTSPGGMGMPSPDGRYLSDVNWAAGNMAVHDLKTGEFRDLTDEGTWKDPIKFGDVSIWSPDSRQIAYCWIDRDGGRTCVSLGSTVPSLVFSIAIRNWDTPGHGRGRRTASTSWRSSRKRRMEPRKERKIMKIRSFWSRLRTDLCAS